MSRNLHLPFCLFLLLAVAGNARLAAQAVSSAAIQGTVRDASGGVLPSGVVEIFNTDTGNTQSVTTDAQGRYIAPELPIGTYQLQVKAAGFRTEVRSGIVLSVGSQLVVDFTLQVGETAQTVTVQGEVPQVETTNASLGTLVEPTQMRELPLNGRNFEQLVTLSPGVIPQIGGASFYGTQQNFSVSGSRPEGQAYLLDGTDVQNFWAHGTGSGALGTSLGIDGIAEFQLLTNTYSPQYGGNGAVLNATTKSGTNELHGSVYEFFRNSALDARNFFDGPKIPPFNRNQFGATLGGPIKKNRLFFFANYEGVRQIFGQSFPAFVPDGPARQGYLPNPSGSLVPVNTSCPAYSATANCILSPEVAAVLQLYPLATSERGNGVGQVTEVGIQRGGEDYGIGRLDYTISDKDSLFMRYGTDRAHILIPNLPTAPILGWPLNNTTANHYATVEERRLFSTSLINVAHFDYVRTNEVQAVAGFNSAMDFFPGTGRENGFVNVQGLSSIGANVLLPSFEIQNKFNFHDDVVWTHGAHTLSFGLGVERVQDNSNAPLFQGGQWTFSGLSSFLQGKAALVTAPLIGQADASGFLRELFFATYLNDEWRLTPRLTLNLGLRWDPTTNPGEVNHSMEALVTTPLGLGSNAQLNPGPFVFTQVPHAFAHNPSLRNFDPRVGFAFDPFNDHKTAIRGGFGMFHDVIQARSILPGYWLNPPYTIGALPGAAFGQDPPLASGPISQSQGLAYQTDATPFQMQYNLNIQRQLGGNTILSVGYVGSRGYDLFMMNDLNPPTNTGTAQNPILGTQNPNGSAIAVPNPKICNCKNLSYLGNKAPVGESNYNSLQASLTHRFTQGLQFQASYTWAKSLDDSSVTYALESTGAAPQFVENPYNFNSDYGLSVFDRAHTVVANAVYDLPIRGNKLVSGWQISGIVTYESGFPFTLVDGFDRAGLTAVAGGATPGERPNLVPGCSNNPIQGLVNQWYNPGCFALQTVGTLGNLGRDTLTGPDFTNLDFALMKTTPIRRASEQLSLQFRAEVFDILNHPNFNLPNQDVFTTCTVGCALGYTTSSIAGQITSTIGNEVVGGAQRVIQFGLKLLF